MDHMRISDMGRGRQIRLAGACNEAAPEWPATAGDRPLRCTGTASAGRSATASKLVSIAGRAVLETGITVLVIVRPELPIQVGANGKPQQS